jgi:hypothetical protein
MMRSLVNKLNSLIRARLQAVMLENARQQTIYRIIYKYGLTA